MATQWWRIRDAYLTKGMTYKELAQKYRLSERTIRNRASKEGWGKEKDKIETEARQEAHARAVRGRAEQLEKLIEANDLIIDSLLAMAGLVKEKPKFYLMDDHQTLKNAESMAKAIQTAAMTQRDLHKLPTLDQDMRKKEEAQRKREAKEKLAIEKEKWQLEKENRTGGPGGNPKLIWVVHEPEEGEPDE